ncbi:MAG: glycosyltransferase family 2 protein [Ignisphaera sp.]
MLAMFWYIPASIIIMSFVYGVPSFFSAISNLKNKIWLNINIDNGANGNNDDPFDIAVLVPLYMEDTSSIEETFKSISRQRYRLGRVDVYVILENDDRKSLISVLELASIIVEKGFNLYIYVNRGSRRSKASSINSILKHIKSLYGAFVILDGGDNILDNTYFEKIAKLVMSGYSIVGTKVYRVGNNVLGKLSYIDTFLWYNVGLPGLAKFIGMPLISGEGLTISSKFIEKIGGLPEVLAEDAYLSILASFYNESIALLDSPIIEGAPSNLKSLVNQRIRWYRGTLQCFKDTITKHRRFLNKKKLVLLSLAYLQPVALTAPFLATVVLIVSQFIQIPAFTVVLAKIELISIALAPSYLILHQKFIDLALLLAPANWIFQGFLALVAMVPVKIPWLRTLNRSVAQLASVYSVKQ